MASLVHRRTRSDEQALTHRRTRSDEPYLSDDDDDDLDSDTPAQELHGTLSKWTNYIHGWQDRYIVLKNGTLSYYKSEHDTNVGCRGAITIHRATIKPHEFDENRFDVSVSDCIWYLRAETLEEKQRWVDTLELHKAESGYGSETSLRRHGSTLSLQSATLSSSSFKKGRDGGVFVDRSCPCDRCSCRSHRLSGLREKLAELETFRDILCRQIDTLQNYFDVCSESVAVLNRQADDERGYGGDLEDEMDDLTIHKETIAGNPKSHSHPLEDSVSKELIVQHGAHAVDFKGEAITFKATTAGILATLSHCIEVMSQREDQLRKKLEKETERRKRLDDLYRQTLQEAQDAQKKAMMIGGPDYEEGPNSVIGEDEFFDAVESGLDKIEEEEELRISGGNENNNKHIVSPYSTHTISIPTTNPLWPEIDRVTRHQQEYALAGVEDGTWTLFAEEGEMKLYKREEEVDGMVCDPLKAVHTIRGVTGHEMAMYFFNPDYRMDWEITLESFKTLETVSEDTMIFHQIHKRVWPATQRDSLFWSHIRRSPNPRDEDQNDIWMVCNHSTSHPSVTTNKMVRVILTVCLVCQTFIDPPKDGQEISRENLTCKVTYCSVVNPGGWAPAPVLRAVYKREYPRFLKRFTQYVKNQCSEAPILF